MKARLWLFFDSLRSSLWFVPTIVVAGAVSLAIALIELEADWLGHSDLAGRWPRLFGAGADGARALLAAIATSMMTVAGVTFSITVVTLSLASSQYTSRILNNFMRDRANQLVLGVFVGVFAYCLVVLRTIRSGDDGLFVPTLAVLFGVVLSFVAIGFLIFFIHHIASSIQATSIIARAAGETLIAIDRLFPSELGQGASEPVAAPVDLSSAVWVSIASVNTGYLVSVDGDALFELARESGTVLRMERGVGDFVIEGAPLASVAGDEPTDAVRRKVNAAYVIGRARTLHQDAAYGVRQIVDIALKALSPGINDTTTAVDCIDFLGAILTRLADRRVETPYREDGGELRVIASGPTFAGLVGKAFDQIRQNADGNVAVLMRLIEVLDLLWERTTSPLRRRALSLQTQLVIEVAERTVPSAYDRERIRAARATRVTGEPAPGCLAVRFERDDGTTCCRSPGGARQGH